MHENLDTPLGGDPFELTDESVQSSKLDSALPDFGSLENGPHWSEKFKYDKYDWEDPEWIRQNKGKGSWLPVPITKGFFMIVEKRDFKSITTHKDGRPKRWRAKIDRDDRDNLAKIYALRSGHSGEVVSIYAHRELKDCLFSSGVVDHVNGWGLDNRISMNLRHTGRSANGSNSIRSRPKNPGLPAGVESIKGGPKKGRYRGKYCKRINKKKVKTFRSKLTWASPDRAHCWYLNRIKEANGGRRAWAHNPNSVDWPVFPPLLKEYDIPF